jgi:hypothetical protein
MVRGESVGGPCRSDPLHLDPPMMFCRIRRVMTFSVATNEYVSSGKEKAEFHSVVTWV